jgi:hypothetical protein
MTQGSAVLAIPLWCRLQLCQGSCRVYGNALGGYPPDGLTRGHREFAMGEYTQGFKAMMFN